MSVVVYLKCFYLGFTHPLELGNRVCQKHQTLGLAWAALLALVLALTAQTLTQRVGQVPVENLAWAANGALGLVALEQLQRIWLALHGEDTDSSLAWLVCTTSLARVLTLLAVELGANGAGDLILDVLCSNGRPGWVLVELSLGVVCNTLLRLDDVLALSGPVNDPALKVQEIRGFHFYFVLFRTKINSLGGHGPEHGVDARTGTGGHLGVTATLVHDLHTRKAHRATGGHDVAASLHWAATAHHDLHTREADGAGTWGDDVAVHLGGAAATHHDLHAGQTDEARARLGAGVQTRQVAGVHTRANTALLVLVLANLAGRLGADGGWHASTGVLQGAHGAAWALDVGGLGIVGHALVRLDDVLAVAGHHDDAVLLIHKLGWSLRTGGTTTSHSSWYYYTRKSLGGRLSSSLTLPLGPTAHTSHIGRHRLISTPGLQLVVGRLDGFTLAALELAHVVLVHLSLGLFPLVVPLLESHHRLGARPVGPQNLGWVLGQVFDV